MVKVHPGMEADENGENKNDNEINEVVIDNKDSNDGNGNASRK